MKKIWKKFKQWFKSVIADPYTMIRDAKAIIKTVESIRRALDSGIFEYAVKNIPGQVDDKILAAIKKALDKVLGAKDVLNKLPEHWPQTEYLSNAASHKIASTALREMYHMDEPEADELIQQVFIGRY